MTIYRIAERPKSDYQNPLVSICCAAYNHEKFIVECIEGFLKQETNFPVEILIHDDASTDGTQRIIRSYEDKHPYLFKPIYQTDNQYSKGLKPSWNFNFPRAKGKYIAICEGDDYWVDPKKLQKQVDFMEANLDYVVCYTDSTPFDENGILTIDYGGARRDLTSEELLKATPIFTLTVLFRNVLGAMPMEFAFAAYGDRALWAYLGSWGRGKYISDIMPSKYRVHSSGLHSMKSSVDLARMNQRTFLALALYHERKDRAEYSEYFEDLALLQCRKLQGISPRLFRLLKFISVNARRLKELLKFC